MSIIVDEFGGTNGLVTIEDLVEEIVGKLKMSMILKKLKRLKKFQKNYEVSARTSIDEFEEKIG